MAKTKVAMVAKEIREELKSTFPSVKFSVRSSNYSMGCSITVEWTDLPSVEAVEAITNKYEKVRRCEATGEILNGGNMYINEYHKLTPEFEALVESQMTELEKDSLYWRRSAMNRIMNKMWEEQNKSIGTEVETEVQQKEKIKVASIVFEWSESAEVKDGHTVTTFAEANEIIRQIGSAKESQGYDKTAFKLIFEDGQEYTGRYDVMKKDAYNGDLSKHVTDFVMFSAGLKQPTHMSYEDWQNLINGKKELWNEFYNSYLLEDPNTATCEAVEQEAPEEIVKPAQAEEMQQEEVEEVQPEEPGEAVETDTVNAETVTNKTEGKAALTINNEKNGIEITFTSKLSSEVLEALKANGFKWSKFAKVWYVKRSADRLAFAESFVNEYNSLGTSEPVNTSADSTYNSEATGERKSSVITFEYPEIDIDDIQNYTVDKQLQQLEHDANWIFRKNEKDRTQEIQSILQHYQTQALEVINSTNNERIIYYLKKSLQSFKRKYHENFVSRLRNRASSPSWAVTGRSNYNVSRAEKANNRYDRLMQESIELTEYIEKAINRAKREMQQIEKEKIKKQVEQTSIDNVRFETVTQEADIYGYKKKFRFYKYNEYMIIKAWGCFRIFKNGKEIDADLKTTDTLETAKRYVLMLDAQKEAVTV